MHLRTNPILAAAVAACALFATHRQLAAATPISYTSGAYLQNFDTLPNSPGQVGGRFSRAWSQRCSQQHRRRHPRLGLCPACLRRNFSDSHDRDHADFASAHGVAVPEPTAMAMLLLPVVILSRRRR